MPPLPPIPSAARHCLRTALALVAASVAAAQDPGDAVVSLPALATAVTLDPAAGVPPFPLRVAWGGGRPRRFSGSIVIGDPDAAGRGDDSGKPPPDWRFLSTASVATTRVSESGRTLHVRQTGECASEEIEILVPDDPATRVSVRLFPDERTDEAVAVTCTLGELIDRDVTRALDGESNRISLRRAPGDQIRVGLEGGAVRRPGETVRLGLHALLPHQGGGASYEMRVRVREGVDGAESYAHTWLLHEAEGRAGDPPGAPPLRFEPIGIDVPLPAREGAYDIVMEVTEREIGRAHV